MKLRTFSIGSNDFSMATGDEEIIRSVSDQRTTTNNESLKRYLFVICFYHGILKPKIYFFGNKRIQFFMDIVVRIIL